MRDSVQARLAAGAGGNRLTTIAPQDLLAEEHVLGAAMLAPAALDRVQAILEPGDFYRDSHGVLYEQMCRLNALGEPVDTVTVVAELEKQGLLKEVGGKNRVYEIARLVPASANVEHYAEIVREHAVLRDLLAATAATNQSVMERDGQSATDLLGQAELALEAVRTRRTRRSDEVVSTFELAQYLDAKFRNPPDMSGWVPTPFRFIQALGPGRLYTCGGYTKDGKTSIGCQFFLTSVKAGITSTYLTLEMSKEDLAERLAAVMGLPARHVQLGKIGDEHKPIARKVLGEMTSFASHAHVWDNPSPDIPAIRAHVKTLQPRFMVVDHLHQFSLRAEYERQDLEATVRGLWNIAREFEMTILLLAQLSRSGDKKHPYPAPSMSSIKGSGAVEQLSWAVWFVYRLRDENNIASDESQFITSANRSGPTGIKPLTFHPRRTVFTEVVREG